MLCKTGHTGSAWGRIRGKVSLNPEQALRMFGFTMNPDALGVIFRQYVYYDDNNHPHTGTFISNYFPASNPRTQKQQDNRARMRSAVIHWQNLPIDKKHKWTRDAEGKKMSGFNLHNSLELKKRRIVVPIGSIIAWHKSLPNTPSLPYGFAECNGQVLDDEDSPYNGQTIPNLNGGKRFIRGSSTSGTNQAEDFKSHRHRLNAKANMQSGTTYAEYGVGTSASSQYTRYTGGTETRPINMSVVWIIKIKS